MAVVASGRVWIFNNGTDSGPFRTKSAPDLRDEARLVGDLHARGIERLGQRGRPRPGSRLPHLARTAGSAAQRPATAERCSGQAGGDTWSQGTRRVGRVGVVQLPDRVIRLVDACDFGVPGCGSGQRSAPALAATRTARWRTTRRSSLRASGPRRCSGSTATDASGSPGRRTARARASRRRWFSSSRTRSRLAASRRSFPARSASRRWSTSPARTPVTS